MQRIMGRDGITREQAKMRLDAQKPAQFYESNCDFILEGIYETSGEFEKECKEFFAGLLKGK